MRALIMLALLGGCSSSGSTQTAAPPPAPTTPDAKEPATPPSAPPATPPPAATAYDFDRDTDGIAPPGFTFGGTGGGAPGRWIVLAALDAPSPHFVLAQTDADRTDNRFPVAVADAPSLRDVRLSVRCKMVSGKVDQACGVVLRYQDADNYYVVRANALEHNIRFYNVVQGKRTMTADWKGQVSAGEWHELVVELYDDPRGQPGYIEARVVWDGTTCFVSSDKKYFDAGKAGLWTKADSVTYFDDLRVEPR